MRVTAVGADAAQWLAIAGAMAGFVTLLAILKRYSSLAAPHPEVVRKLLHTGAGLMTLPFPFLFSEAWPVLVLTAWTAAILATVKFVQRWRRRFGDVVDGVARTTFGELYFPAAVLAVFWLSREESPLLFVIPMLILSTADAVGALVGLRYGSTRYGRGSKSVEGSSAFLVTAFAATFGPLAAWSSLSALEGLLVSAIVAQVLTVLEASATRGRDNILIPLVAYFLLRRLLGIGVAALQVWLVAAGALLAVSTLLAIGRRRRVRPGGGSGSTRAALTTGALP